MKLNRPSNHGSIPLSLPFFPSPSSFMRWAWPSRALHSLLLPSLCSTAGPAWLHPSSFFLPRSNGPTILLLFPFSFISSRWACYPSPARLSLFLFFSLPFFLADQAEILAQMQAPSHPTSSFFPFLKWIGPANLFTAAQS